VRFEGIPLGRYQVEVTLLGFERHVERDVELTAENPTAELGTIQLATLAVRMDAIVAETERPQVTIAADRTIYNTGDMPAVQGGVATDVLRTVPELEVDMDGKVKLRGSNVQIHLNGRPAPMQGEALDRFLQQLPANRIDRVEVIANPGARYDAEGQGGIVNLVMKENFSLGLSGNVFIGSSTRNQNNVSGRLSYQSGPLTLFGGGTLNLSKNEFTDRDQRENLLAQPVTIFNQASNNVNRWNYHSGDVTAELKLGKKTVSWSELRFFGNGFNSRGTSAYTITDRELTPLERYDRLNRSENSGLNGTLTLGVRHQFEPQRHEFSFEVRGVRDRRDTYSVSTRQLYPVSPGEELPPDEQTRNDRDEARDEIVIQTDYTRPLGEKGKIDVGYRGTIRETDNEQTMVITQATDGSPIGSQPSAFDYLERFHAFYASHAATHGKVSYQVGVRAEQATTRFLLPLVTDGESRFENDYFSVFPNGNVAYDFGQGRRLRLAYTKRFDRPWVFALNPMNPSTDPLNRHVGNPYLKPKYTHNFSLDASWTGKVGTARIAPYFRRTVDNWDRIRLVDENGVSTMTWENLARHDQYGTGITGSLQQRGRLGGSANFSLWREVRDMTGSAYDFSGSSTRWSINTNLMFRVNKGLNVQGFAWYTPSYDVPQGRYTTSVMSNIGIRQQINGNKASVNLSIQDPFDVYRFTFETRDQSHVQTGRTRYPIRQARLTFNYNFGRPPQSQRRRPRWIECRRELAATFVGTPARLAILPSR
jgi:hypothetical protein